MAAIAASSRFSSASVRSRRSSVFSILLSSATTGRAASLVPPIHIAIVREQDILPDLVDVWPFLAARNIPTSSSSFTLITGPSKTADIEGILITGVHGPREVHIYVVSNV